MRDSTIIIRLALVDTIREGRFKQHIHPNMCINSSTECCITVCSQTCIKDALLSKSNTTYLQNSHECFTYSGANTYTYTHLDTMLI